MQRGQSLLVAFVHIIPLLYQFRYHVGSFNFVQGAPPFFPIHIIILALAFVIRLVHLLLQQADNLWVAGHVDRTVAGIGHREGICAFFEQQLDHLFIAAQGLHMQRGQPGNGGMLRWQSSRPDTRAAEPDGKRRGFAVIAQVHAGETAEPGGVHVVPGLIELDDFLLAGSVKQLAEGVDGGGVFVCFHGVIHYVCLCCFCFSRKFVKAEFSQKGVKISSGVGEIKKRAARKHAARLNVYRENEKNQKILI